MGLAQKHEGRPQVRTAFVWEKTKVPVNLRPKVLNDLGIVAPTLATKNKYVARMGHPMFLTNRRRRGQLPAPCAG